MIHKFYQATFLLVSFYHLAIAARPIKNFRLEVLQSSQAQLQNIARNQQTLPDVVYRPSKNRIAVIVKGNPVPLEGIIMRNNGEPLGDGAYAVEVDQQQLDVLKSYPGVKIDSLVTNLHLTDGLADEFVSPTRRHLDSSWGLKAVYGEQINQVGTYRQGGQGAVVCIVDSGVDFTHPALRNRLAGCMDMTNTGSTCPVRHSHGTHVAGVIAADGGDSTNFKGIAPSARLRSYVVCDEEGKCSSDVVERAVIQGVADGCNIINMSLGGPNVPRLARAIEYAVDSNVLVVSGTGNMGPPPAGQSSSVIFPANIPGVIAVAALTKDPSAGFGSPGSFDKFSLADYSSRGPEVDIALPGTGVYSTMPGGSFGLKEGTSVAAPHACGLAALLWDGSAASTKRMLLGGGEGSLSVKDIAYAGDRQWIWAGQDPGTGMGMPSIA